jgi:hypothetical protein
VTGVPGQMKLKDYLLGFMPSGEPDIVRKPDLKTLSDFGASLAHLKSLKVARLEHLLTGTLDLCSHRLDAWITSFATKRLAEMRKASPAGVLLGGYGWVMNLKPANPQTKVAPPPLGEQDPVFQSANRLRSYAFVDAGFYRRNFAQRPSGPFRKSAERSAAH